MDKHVDNGEYQGGPNGNGFPSHGPNGSNISKTTMGRWDIHEF